MKPVHYCQFNDSRLNHKCSLPDLKLSAPEILELKRIDVKLIS